VAAYNDNDLCVGRMPAKFKVLKRVAHNIGDSFTSPMNFSVDDYSMGGSHEKLGSAL
jgi:hypothetical protein